MESRSPVSFKGGRGPPIHCARVVDPTELGKRATAGGIGHRFLRYQRSKGTGLVRRGGPYLLAHQRTILGLTSSARLPTIHELRRWPEEGAVMSYGPDLHDLFRRSAFYVGKILRGAKPADIPVEQPTKFEFIVNLKTAKALGLDLPNSLVALADEVIE